MRYVVVHQTNDGELAVALITRKLEKAERKAQKITNADTGAFGYVLVYQKERPNRDFTIK